MGHDVLDLQEVDRTQVDLVGGKGANLGELARLDGVRVPAGFCVTTGAFRRAVRGDRAVEVALDRLSVVAPGDHVAIGTASAAVREAIEAIAVPDDLATAIADEVERLGRDDAYAVRSSATAEDLPSASFAGQQDSYLNVLGAPEFVRHVRRCWASLFTDRAVTYRLQHGIEHRDAHMAVVVQRMVAANAAGVLFTADPVTGDRTVTSIEAIVGLGEALVSGLVTPDRYRVRRDVVLDQAIGTKQLVTRALAAGGTEDEPVDPADQEEAALRDEQVVELARLGRRVEVHLGRAQDIEWCLADDGFHLVQSRPITTLFPIPAVVDDEHHVFVSVGHGQMMTDAMTPLGLDVWKRTAGPPMHEAGGRLFVDVTQGLASPATRTGILGALGQGDPLIGDALQAIVDREGFLPAPAAGAPPGPPPGGGADPIATDPAIVRELIERTEASIAASAGVLRTSSGPDVLAFIADDIRELKRVLFDPVSHQAIMAGMDAAWWLNDRLGAWLGEINVADTLSRSVPGNVTADMGLALLDVADAIRPHPEVVAFLQAVEGEEFLDQLPALDGGVEARDAIEAFLDRYGMRCVGEIDITRPRWRERPSTLLPAILGNVRGFEPGAGARRFEQGRREAEAKAIEVLARLRQLPDGEGKAEEAERMIHRLRTFAGFREYPKYGIVCRSWLYQRAIVAEAERLVGERVLRVPDDAFFLTLAELEEVARSGRADLELVDARREAFRTHEALIPPRVLTSDGEAVAGSYRRQDVPDGALAGLAVSSGTVEGRARVIHDIGAADLEPGDILVTGFTDPSWTPLFVTVAGLVTEVGGLMTHGAVVAREYGLPAVVGVQHATRLIPDGRRIRVHGTAGYVELLPEEVP